MATFFLQYRDRSETAGISDLTAEAPWYVRPVCGGIAGFGLLCPVFPADSVKTLMQTNSDKARAGFIRTAQGMFREGGVRAFYNGFPITMARAFPANAVVFSVYDLVCDALMKRGY
jgi:hypothetical protein